MSGALFQLIPCVILLRPVNSSLLVCIWGKSIFYRVSHKKGIYKKFLFGAAQGLNLQFLNLFGFSISVSFVWCII